MLNSLRSADDFIDTNGDALGGVVNSSMRTMLRDAITALSGHASEQNGVARARHRALDRCVSPRRASTVRALGVV
jgi:hypothetical protein